ncbi:hypothetical protein CBR_g40583 [Chara braunii]|uniref:Uncharacterized protein n=1 Tax=Chara braunii TaxID=69332 RepID=A0A388K267_CHABU|nr:hypothetical protein CBR_g40583 [Chara braunii]|eukprot:GBG64136.1 hypothetical protein CBR_g40583 [Chara braunii]
MERWEEEGPCSLIQCPGTNLLTQGAALELLKTRPRRWSYGAHSSGDDEVMLSDLWQGYQEATSLENGQRAFEAFLMSFIRVYENWTPTENPVPLSQLHPTDVPPRPVYGEGLFGTPLLQGGQGDVIIGCASGHPTRVILGLVQELKMVRKMIAQASVSQDDVELKLRDAEENAFGLSLLHALNIATRSAHNRRIFVFYEGFGNLMRLMKAAVIQVKAVATAMTSDRNPSSLIFTQLTFLQLLLAHVISIVANFVEAELNHQSRYSETRSSSPRSRPGSGSWGIGIGAADTLSYPGSAGSSRPSSRPASPRHRHYGGGSGNASPVNPHFTSMESVPLLETNGLNWCVELLRILRRLRVEGLLNDSALERLTLRTLRSAIACSYRVQNHFRSIGGLDVLLDGLGWPSLRGLFRERLSAGHLPGEDDRIAGQLEAEFQMQLLSLRVIREAVYPFRLPHLSQKVWTSYVLDTIAGLG